MDKNNAKDYLPLVQALADGKIIQVLDVTGKYIDIRGNIMFSSDADQYRIKPEPKKGWYRVALCSNMVRGCRVTYTTTIDTEWEEGELTDNPTDFVQWLTDFVEYELPEEEV